MKYLIAAAALAASVATSASALTVSYSDSIASLATDWQESLFLTQFDTSLGTLNSATLTLEGTATGSVMLERTSANFTIPRTYSYGLGSEIYASVTGVSNLDVQIDPEAGTSVSLGPYDGTLDYAGTSGTSDASLTASDSSSETITSDFGQLLGTGTFEISLLALGTFYVSGGGNFEQEVTNFATASASITYDYSPAVVPLPAGAPLLLLGVGGLALLRRRKKS